VATHFEFHVLRRGFGFSVVSCAVGRVGVEEGCREVGELEGFEGWGY
jgi:hypothetical protein